MLDKYSKWLVGNPYLILILSILTISIIGFGVTKLGMDQDYRVFFSKEFPPLEALDQIHKTYNKNDNVLFVIEPKDGTIFSKDTLAIVKELTDKAWTIPYSTRVESVTNFQFTRSDGDNLVVSDLVETPLNLNSRQLDVIKDIAINEPTLRNRLISTTGHVTGVNVVIELPGKTTSEAPAVVDYVRQMKAELQEKHPGVNVYLTGIVMMNHAFPEASMSDMMTLVPIMFLVIIVLIGFLLRSFWGTVGTLAVIMFSVVAALGMSGWLGVNITPPSASTPTLIMTLALADSIHFLIYMFREMRNGKTKSEAIVTSLKVNMQPIILTSVATIIGFMGMNFSESPPFRDLGNITAMGVFAALIFSVAFLPAFMKVVPVKGKVGHIWLDKLVSRIADIVILKRKTLIVVMSGFVIFLAVFIPRIELNDQWLEYFGYNLEFRPDTEFAVQHLIGVYTIEYSIPAKNSGGVADPEYLKALEQFTEWYRNQTEVVHVSSMIDVMKRINKNMHGDKDNSYILPERRKQASQYLLLYELSLPFGHDLNNMINVDKSSSRVIVSLKNVSTVNMKELEKRAENWLTNNAPSYMFAHGSSPTLMFAHISQRNIRQMLTGTTMALFLVSLVLVYALKSFKLGMFSLIPNLVPAVMGFGFWGLIVGEVGLAVSIMAAMTLGIVVDDTVHFMSKFRRAKEQGMTDEDSVRYAFSTVGSALIVTTVILAAGFMVLSQSTFAMNSQMGFLTAITIIFALAADFLLLPSLLLVFSRKKLKRKAGLENYTELEDVKL